MSIKRYAKKRKMTEYQVFGKPAVLSGQNYRGSDGNKIKTSIF